MEFLLWQERWATHLKVLGPLEGPFKKSPLDPQEELDPPCPLPLVQPIGATLDL